MTAGVRSNDSQKKMGRRGRRRNKSHWEIGENFYIFTIEILAAVGGPRLWTPVYVSG
uniref:Uncharacterized protein n=1 Tax=Nelumbo nucifera TaxID=4432 RepID=A0A822ZSB4_NELNU|nr:TPA_asm: hypothetical protein HUJ06_017714 [Nelumbo nucifera]